MGNTNTSTTSKRDRTYSVDSAYDRRESSSPGSQDNRTFEFVAGGRKKPVLCYQSSSEYGPEETIDEFNKGRVRASTISEGAAINENALPTVFKWEGGGKEVFITGTFSDWKPIKMCHSHGDFVAIIDVPEGTHNYKFVVDGQEVVDEKISVDEDKQNNVINIKKGDFEVFEALAMDLASNNNNANNNYNNNNNNNSSSGSPPGSYSQELPSRATEFGNNVQMSGAGPPILPPHLLQVILNNPNVNFCEPTLLPQPNHVMLNHLYALSIKDGVMVLSATHRYRKKYVTTLLYKPI
ncbi:5'-AMP-activated protein kinase subunit beta-1-like isoform X1 [Oppia nitens]|nr:5'-AMP-activated protein kinase subunit beta-1-like isoform X1 [Oppia nitens]XP_054154255.1 5'-AMP-activated protein kinase subunit beta-1-like isoform X1 [Oppia nitens]